MVESEATSLNKELPASAKRRNFKPETVAKEYARTRKWRAEHKIEQQEYFKKLWGTPERQASHKIQAKESYERSKVNPSFKSQRKRNAFLWGLKQYGLTEVLYHKMLKEQNGLCAICKNKPKRFSIDHCHSTGRVRALLCNNCNAGLGFFKDSPELLVIAEAYLRKHSPLETPKEL